MITHLDLFTGIGGFHLAAGLAGFETIGFSEVEPYCCQLLWEKWPEIKNYGDVRIARNFEPLRGRVDVLSAGVPCQPASLAGKRKGSSDARWLWPATLDVVGSVNPTWCIFENPPGILSLREFETVLLRLETLGYQVRMFSVPANAVGADHLRYRVFIVANSAGDRSRSRVGIGGRNIKAEQEWALNGSGAASKIKATLAAANSSQRWTPQPAGDEHHGPETGRRESADRLEGVCDPDAADTESERCGEEGRLQPVRSENWAGWNIPTRRPFRLTQPPICLSVNGLPGELDGDQINAQNTRAAIGQDLFNLPAGIQSDSVQRNPRGQHPVSDEEILFRQMHGRSETETASDPGRLPEADSTSSADGLQGVRSDRETFDSSQGSGLEQQRPGEHPNPMLQMPHLTAPPLVRGRTIKNRSAQLKALGNSVCPQQAYPFFKAIAQVILGEVTDLVVHGDPEK